MRNYTITLNTKEYSNLLKEIDSIDLYDYIQENVIITEEEE